MKAVLAQADPMGPDIEDGGKGWVLIDDSGPLLIWGVGMLLLSCTSSGAAAASTALEGQIADATAAILLTRFTSRPIPEICAMGGITLEDFSKSVAYREIFGLGEAQGREQGLEQGLKTGELELTMRLLQRRCGGDTPSQEARICALPLPQLEALAEALLDFQAAADLEAWLATS